MTWAQNFEGNVCISHSAYILWKDMDSNDSYLPLGKKKSKIGHLHIVEREKIWIHSFYKGISSKVKRTQSHSEFSLDNCYTNYICVKVSVRMKAQHSDVFITTMFLKNKEISGPINNWMLILRNLGHTCTPFFGI